MSGKTGQFFFYEPAPNESVLVTIAMALFLAMCLVTGIGLAVQLHWAAIPAFAFAGFLAWALSITRKYARADQRVELTPAAADILRLSLAAHIDSANARLLVALEPSEIGTLDVVVRIASGIRWPDEILRYYSHGTPMAVHVRHLDRLRGTVIDFDRQRNELVVRILDCAADEGTVHEFRQSIDSIGAARTSSRG